jgi:hypothetical protein
MKKIDSRIYSFGAYLLIGCTLVACGGGGGGNSTSQPNEPALQDAANDPPNASGGGSESGNDPPNPGGGGTESGDDASNTDDGGTSNTSPSIAGKPTLSIVQNSDYEFVASATDPDGDPLTFIAINIPDWASFDLVTGALSGAPKFVDIGMTGDISIGATDGMLTSFLPPFRITVLPFGDASVTLSWTIPSTNEDGTPLTDLAGFTAYYGATTGSYSHSTTIDNPGVTSLFLENFSYGHTYYFAITAFDESGNESEYSDEVSQVF